MSKPRTFTCPNFTNPHHFSSHGQFSWFCNLCFSAKDRNGRAQYMTAKVALDHERSSEQHLRNLVCEEAGRWEWSDALPHPDEQTSSSSHTISLSSQEFRDLQSKSSVDHGDLVSFWIRSVEAATRGEVMRLEEFLETLSKNPWGVWSTEPWDASVCPPGQRRNVVLEDGEGGWGIAGKDWPTEARSLETWGWSHRGWGTGAGGSGGVVVEPNMPTYGLGRLAPQHLHPSSAGRKSPLGSQQSMLSISNPRQPKSYSSQQGSHRGLETDVNAFVEKIARQESMGSVRRQRMHAFVKLQSQDKIKAIREIIDSLHSAQM